MVGAAKAWVNFNGTFGSSPFTIANGGIRAAFNVSSITDNGTGDYTVNFITAMPDADYCAVILAGSSTPTFAFLRQMHAGTTTTQRFLLTNSTPTAIDVDNINVAIFR